MSVHLLSELKDNSEEYNLDLAKDTFSYESSELNQLLELIRKGQNLYDEFKPHLNLSFINSSKISWRQSIYYRTAD